MGSEYLREWGQDINLRQLAEGTGMMMLGDAGDSVKVANHSSMIFPSPIQQPGDSPKEGK